MASTNLSIRLAVEGAQKGAADLAVVDAQLNLIGSSASRGAAAFVKFNGASSLTHVQKLKSTFQDTGIAINSASSQVEKLVTRMQRVSRERAFQQLASDANLSAMQMARLRASMGDTRGALSSLGRAASAAKFAIAAWGAAVLYAGKACLDAQIQMQRLEQSYKAVFGAGAGAQLQAVYEQANRVGLKFVETAEAAKSLFAAGQGTSLAPQLNDIFKAVTNAGAALQLSTEQVNGTFIALGQMMSKGKVQAEELRGQLGERLPGAFQMAARAMGMTTAELDKFMADGKLTAEDLLPRLAEVLEEKYARAAENAAHTVQGSINRMSTEWERFKAGLIESGPAVFTVQIVTEVLRDFNNRIAKVRDDARIDEKLRKWGVSPDAWREAGFSLTNPEIEAGYSDELRAVVRQGEADQAARQAAADARAIQRERTSADARAAIEKALKGTVEQKKADLEKEKSAAVSAIRKEIAAARAEGSNADTLADLEADLARVETVYDGKLAELGKKGAAAAKAAAVAQADYTGELERTQQQIDSLQQQLALDRGEDLARAKIRIEQQYQATLSKTREELDKQVARGALTRSQAEALELEKGKAAELQKQVSLRDAENAASEKAIRLAEGQLSFYRELGELGGKYENHLDLQVQLIEEQAKKYKDLKIPPKLIEDWKKLKLLQVSTDPFDGAYRGLLKFTAEYSDAGKQWEGITHGFASDFNSATRDMFDDFLDTGRASFDDLGRLFKRLLRDMAYQALIQPVVLSMVNGAAGALHGSTTAGGAGGAAAAGTGMGYAGSVIQLGAQAAQGYAVNQLMSGSGGMFGGIANSINSTVAGMFPSLFAPSASVAAANSTVSGVYSAMGLSAPSSLGGTSTFTGMLGGAGLAGGLGSLGYGLLGGAIGLPQSPYSGITSGIGSALGYMGGSTLGASLGGTIGSVVPVVGTIVGALAGGLLGSVFGGWEDDPPELHYGTTFSLTDFGTASTQSPFGRGSRHDASGYYTFALGAEGLGAEIPNQVEPLLHSTVTSLIDMSRSFADSLGSVSQGMRDDYINALNEQGPVFRHFKLDGDWINDEQIEGHLKQLTKTAGEKIVNALGKVDLQPLSIAADGIAADTVDELGQSLTQAFSFYDMGETFEDEKLKAQFQARAQKQIVDAFADLDFSFLRVDFDKSSFAGLQQAYAAVRAWDTVAAGLEAILNPLSELSTQLNTATTQFNGWVANLRDLGWQEEAIAEIEQRRAQYLHEYATAVTRAGEQDMALRSLALELGSDSDAYGIRSLQYRQETELAQLAKQYGRDSGLYSTAVEIQQAELAQARVNQLEKELEKALAAERQAAQAATQNQTTALNNQASALRDSAREAERMRDAFADIVDALEEARRDIWASSDDNLLGTSHRESMAAFEDAYARGMAGDQDALRELPGLADSLLASGRESLATYEQYNDLFYDVDQKLKAAQAQAQSGYDAQAAIADSLNAQLDAITAQTDALQKAINAGTAAGEYTGRSVDAIRAELELMRAVLAKEKADVAGDTSAGGASLSQREALLWAKSNQLNAQAHMGRTDWTPESTLSEIYRNNLTLESWYDRYGRYEGLGVEYDTAAARQSIMANKAALLNSQAYQGRTDWIEQDVAAAIANAGMTKDDWYLRHGLGEGVQSGYKAYTGNALYDYDQLLRDKAADLSAEGYLGIAHWTALDVAAEIANQGMTVPQWYELYGKQEGYALKAAATTNKTVEKGLSSVSGAMNKQLASSQALGSIMSGVGSSVSGYMQAVQSGMSGLSSSISRLNLNVTVNVTGGSSSTSSSGTSGASGASGAAPVVDPFARLSSATGVFGSHYQSEYALLTAKARRMMDDGEFDNLPDGYTSWTAAAVAQAIRNSGLSGTKEWYEKHGKVEGFATGGITPADEVFWVGENGPELMMSPRRWGVLSNADSMSLLDSRGAPPVYAVMGKDNREIVAELREIKGYLRQVVTKADKTAYCADRINGLLRMWDAEGLPATSAA